MQPYFLPYVGYFQLINHCDTFVLYDNVEYSTKGWITRNRLQINGMTKVFSLQLKKSSNHLQINQKVLAQSFDRKKLLRQFDGAYRKSKYWNQARVALEEIILYEDNNLYTYVENSIMHVCDYIGIETRILRSSEIEATNNLRGEDRVLSVCKAVKALEYVNPIGGIDLYDKSKFNNHGINLKFLRSKLSPYDQGGVDFSPALSIVDLMANLDVTQIRKLLSSDFEIL